MRRAEAQAAACAASASTAAAAIEVGAEVGEGAGFAPACGADACSTCTDLGGDKRHGHVSQPKQAPKPKPALEQKQKKKAQVPLQPLLISHFFKPRPQLHVPGQGGMNIS